MRDLLRMEKRHSPPSAAKARGIRSGERNLLSNICRAAGTISPTGGGGCVTPTMYTYLSYRDAAGALRFLEEAFGFTTSVRWDAPDGTVQRAEATFGDGAVMMGTGPHATAPLDGVGVGQGIYAYVEDVDALPLSAGRRRPGGVPAGGHRLGNAPLSRTGSGRVWMELR
jgi:hypothetical protein